MDQQQQLTPMLTHLAHDLTHAALQQPPDTVGRPLNAAAAALHLTAALTDPKRDRNSDGNGRRRQALDLVDTVWKAVHLSSRDVPDGLAVTRARQAATAACWAAHHALVAAEFAADPGTSWRPPDGDPCEAATFAVAASRTRLGELWQATGDERPGRDGPSQLADAAEVRR